MTRTRRMLTVALGFALFAGAASANNLSITNVSVEGHGATTALVKFDISWDNSWRFAAGGDQLYLHDAAWVFFKVKMEGAGDWKHVKLEGTGVNPTGFDIGTGTAIEMVVPADGAGMFVRRSSDGAGTTDAQQVTAVWNFAANGFSKNDKVKIQAMGIEMCYVAQGAFEVGDGQGDMGQFEDGQSGQPFAITSVSQEIVLGGGQAGSLCSHNGAGMNGKDDFTYTVSTQLPTSYPTGYNAFYCMKYLITQGQYADFLNLLTREQQATRCTATTVGNYMSATAGGHAASQNRNTVQLLEDPGDPQPRRYATETPDRACNWLCWADLAAFADWSGLRPMSELEFEKACRGPLPPMPGEYAWGTEFYTVISGLQGDDGSGEEYYTAGNLICSGSAPYEGGPVRVGIFARPGSTREQAGASYWGIMELSGNLWDRCVSIGKTSGRDFTGLHGNGLLASNGNADVAYWPPASAGGIGARGGTWNFAAAHTRTSSRWLADYTEAIRGNNIGGRVVRAAPSITP